jgi:hypothetical protein
MHCNPEAVTYMVDGARSEASSAAKAGDFSLAHVSYPNGDHIVSNNRRSIFTWNLLGVTGGVPRVPTESWTVGESLLDNMFGFYLPATMPDGTYRMSTVPTPS